MHPRVKLLLVGVCFHIIYIGSIFDIYFRSPLIHGMTPVQPPKPPAKRLLLAVGDGLRADKLFENRSERAPFLREKVLEKGRWGVSHTRVPTESRPGHVALIAGFYEDVSAVTKGWKMNPVNFDSLFNQSFHTWSFGSPDILPMFAYGASDPSKIEMFMYGAEEEDFAEDDASTLDTWVFDHFEQLFKQAETNSTLKELLFQEKIVFFLHLLGLDTNGHGHRPYSEQYLNNIKVVDRGLRKVEEMINKFYGDLSTAFVFTADHGMSNRGSHGDGDPQNTETPLIAWGAGISKANTIDPSGHDERSLREWKLGNVQRNDVNQADIAPLMSTLIGVPFPLNSVGVLPIDYLENTEQYKAETSFLNAFALLNQFLKKQDMKRRQEFIFRPFEPLRNVDQTIKEIRTLIDNHEFKKAELKSRGLMDVTVEGLRYYQTYDWLLLRTIVTLGYLGWICFSSLFILKTYAYGIEPTLDTSDGSFSIVLVVFGALATLLHLKEAELSYYAYLFFPIYFWTNVISQKKFVSKLVKSLDWTKHKSTILNTVLYLIALEFLVLSYFYRELLTPCLLVMGFGWPLTIEKSIKARHFLLVRSWKILCTLTSVFTLLPVDLEENVYLILVGSICVLMTSLVAVILLPRYIQAALPTNQGKKLDLRMGILVVAMVVVFDTSRSLEAKEGLPTINAIISWMILICCILIPILERKQTDQHYLQRLLVIYLAFAPVFTLLSTGFETIFYCFYSLVVCLWMLLEQQLYFFSHKSFNGKTYSDSIGSFPLKSRMLQSSDMRIASFFLVFINVAFFGTGNMASISSFTISSVYRFTTVFDPFLMGSLLIFKILIPFFLLSSILSVLSRCLELPPFSLFLLVLSTTDMMTLNFFFLVRDSGSWLEIGTSISHFCIASAFIVFQILLFSTSHILVGGVLVPIKASLKDE